MNQHRRTWTPEEDATVRHLWNENVRAADIGAQLGRTVKAVEYRASKLGLPARPHMRVAAAARARASIAARASGYAKRAWTPQDIRDLRRMWSEGVVLAEISERLRRNRSTIQSKAKAIGLKPRHHLSGLSGDNPDRAAGPVAPVARELTREEERRLIEEAAQRGRVTKCPPAYAAPVQGARRLDVPVYEGNKGGRWVPSGFQS